MTIRIETLRLIDLINDLRHTADQDPENGAVAGILLHTDRGYPRAEPGKQDILVGTSTNRHAIGHTYVSCSGQMSQPMLWPIQSALAVVNLFKPATKDNKEHTVEIRYGDGNIHVEEDKDLFGGAMEFQFAAGNAAKFPALWGFLQYDQLWEPGRSAPWDTEPAPRTDLTATALEPFVKVAKQHGGTIEMYRYHQRRPVLISIGDHYRGAVTPRDWNDDKNPQAGRSPFGEVYATELPPDTDATDRVDPASLLQQAADMVITSQMASASMLIRKLRVSPGKAGTLLDQLEILGVVGPVRGSKAREVLVHTGQLGVVLGKIRTQETAVTAAGVEEPELPAETEEEPADA